MKTGDGRKLPAQLKAELLRELTRIELALQQIEEVETERNAAIQSKRYGEHTSVALLARLKAIGPQIAAVLYHEGLYRDFGSRRVVASYAGLTPSP